MKNFDEIGVSYFLNRHRGHFLEDLKTLKKAGFNSVLHTFSEADLLYGPGNVRDMVAISREKGFTAWISPWGVGKAFGGEALSDFLLENTSAWQVMSDGKKYPAACINNPMFRKFMLQWTDAAVSYGADAIMWDEPRFITEQKGKKKIWGCRCPYCRESYEIMNLKSMPLFKMDESVKNFRELSIKRFISFLSAYAKEKSGGKIRISALFTSPSAGGISPNSFFESAANLKAVDSLGCAPYWFNTPGRLDIYGHSLMAAKNLKEICDMSGKKPHFWLQGFGLKKGRETDVLKAIDAVKDSGIRNLWVWGFNGGEMMSSLSSENPEKTWSVIVKGINSGKD
jgi:hypothetical protein